MRIITFLLATFFATVVFAQSPTPGVFPNCAVKCNNDAAKDAGCGAVTNTTCICRSTSFMIDAIQCFQNACTVTELQIAAGLQSSLCIDPSSFPTRLFPTDTSTATGGARTSSTTSRGTSSSGGEAPTYSSYSQPSGGAYDPGSTSSSSPGSDDADKKSFPIGAIIGIAAGAAVALGVALFFIIRRCRRPKSHGMIELDAQEIKTSPYYSAPNPDPYANSPFLTPSSASSTTNLHAAPYNPNTPYLTAHSPVGAYPPPSGYAPSMPSAPMTMTYPSGKQPFPPSELSTPTPTITTFTSPPPSTISPPPSVIASSSGSGSGTSKRTAFYPANPSPGEDMSIRKAPLPISHASSSSSAHEHNVMPTPHQLHPAFNSSGPLSPQQLELIERLTQLNVPAHQIARMVDNMAAGGGQGTSATAMAITDDTDDGANMAPPPSYDAAAAQGPQR